MNNFNNEKCKEFTIYTEDICFRFSNCTDKSACQGCGGFSDFINWLKDKSPEKKSFF